MRSPRPFSSSTTFAVPFTAGPSSSEVIRRAIDPLWEGCFATKCSAATTKAAIEVFMSAAPRPKSLPSRSVGAKGSACHRSSGPGGTTSVCPTKHSKGRTSPRRAQRFATSPLRTGSIANPSRARRAASSSWQPPSSGVIERRAISSRASSSVAAVSAAGMGSFGETVPAERNAVDPDSLHQCLSALGLGHVELEVAGRSGGGERRGLCLGLSFLARRNIGAGLGVVDKPQQVIGGVGVGKRLVLAEDAFADHLEQRLLEGLRSGGERLFHRLLHFADLAFFDHIGHVAAVQHDLLR